MVRTIGHSLNGRPLVPAQGDKPAARPAGAPWPMRDAASYWAVSERHVAALVAAGKVRSIKIGGRRLIPDDEVMRVAREGTS